MSAFSEWFTRYMPTVGMMNDQHRFELCWNAAIKSVEVAPAASTNSAMPKLPCAKKWLEWCKVKAVPLDIQWDIYEWFKRQLSA